MQPPKRKWLKRVLLVILSLGTALLAAALIVFWPLLRILYEEIHEVRYDRRLCTQIVADIKTGKLVPNSSGVVQLPPDLAPATVDGRAYVTRRPAGKILVLFVAWQGKSANMRGYLYSSHPLTSRDLLKDYYSRDNIVVASPCVGTVINVDLVVEKWLYPNWYRVYHDLE